MCIGAALRSRRRVARAWRCIAPRATGSILAEWPYCAPLPVRSLDHDLRRGAPGAAALELIAHLGGDVAIDFRMRAIRLGRDHGKPGIGLLADGHVQTHLAEAPHTD